MGWNGFWTRTGMNTLLRMKHWQIFLLVVGTAIILQMIQNIWYFSAGDAYPLPPQNILGLVLVVPLLIYFAWIAAVGLRFSRSTLSPSMKIGRFRTSLWISCISHILLLVYFWYYPRYLAQAGEEEVVPVSVITILVFVALLTLFYCLSFLAKAVVQAERSNKIVSAEYFSEFIMALMFPLGICFLQPRINRLEKEAAV